MASFQVRTDLALEEHERVKERNAKIHGIEVEEYCDKKNEIYVSRVHIESRNAAKTLGKPVGNYVTIESCALAEPDDDFHKATASMISREIRRMMANATREQSILVAGLGNREVTADSLGPSVIDQLYITRHIVNEYGRAAYGKERINLISSIEPGVMAKTGMETAEIVHGVIREIEPNLLIVVDALAARSTKRLHSTIQITDTGIWPGSGVGNHRNALTKESLGIPVIAIGVPTVVDAASMVGEVVERLLKDVTKIDYLHQIGRYRNLISELSNMYMTGKDIDALIKRVSFTLAEGINQALAID